MGAEEQQPVRKMVDISAVNLNNIRGSIVGLNLKEVFWRPENGSSEVELNRMSGAISLEVPKGVTDYDATCIINGLRSGRLIMLEKAITTEPMKNINASIASDALISARRLLDEQDVSIFEKNLERQPVTVIEACLELEKSESNRPNFTDIIRNRLRMD